MTIDEIIEAHKELTDEICDDLYDFWCTSYNNHCHYKEWDFSNEKQNWDSRKAAHEKFVKRIKEEGITQ